MNSAEENSPVASVGIRTRNLSIACPALLPTSYFGREYCDSKKHNARMCWMKVMISVDSINDSQATKWLKTNQCSVSHITLTSVPQWGAADAEIKVPSGENTELKRSPFKAWSRSVYTHTCYAYCQGFLPCLFLPLRSSHLHFSKTSPDFSCVGRG